MQIYVEIQRARLTRKLAAYKEAEGKVSEAADILQEVAVVSHGGGWSKFSRSAWPTVQVGVGMVLTKLGVRCGSS